MSLRALFAIAAIVLAAAAPIHAQILDGGTFSMGYTSGVYYSVGVYTYTTSLNINDRVDSGTLTKAGTGTLTLPSNTNTYTGGITVDRGTIMVGSSSNVIVTGTSEPVFTGNIAYTGSTTVSGGVLIIGTPQPIGDGGTLIFSIDSLTLSPNALIPFDLSTGLLLGSGKLVRLSVGAAQDATSTDDATTTELPSLQPLTINAVPEPSTIGLLIVAALGAGLTGIRRKVG